MRYTPKIYLIFFFFSSRRRHTRFDCDWSSDVCSSDLWRRPCGARAEWETCHAEWRRRCRCPWRARLRGRARHATTRRARKRPRRRRPLRRSEEHTSELQSQSNLVCRLLLEKKKNINTNNYLTYMKAFNIIKSHHPVLILQIMTSSTSLSRLCNNYYTSVYHDIIMSRLIVSV